MTDAETAYFLKHIHAASHSNFGLVKMSALHIDHLCDPSAWAALFPPGHEHQPHRRMTLLHFSASLRRDRITGSLLRAGACPITTETLSDRDLSSLVKAYFRRVPPSYAVHIINTFVSLASVPDPNTACSACPLASDHSTSRILKLPLCGDHVCEAAFWRVVVLQRSPFEDLACPTCQSHLYPLPPAVLPPNMDTLTPSEIAQQSRARWLELPVSLDILNSKKPVFVAMSLTAQVSLFIGLVRAQRCLELSRAASLGNAARILALVAAGVLVDARDEYGQTALFVAATAGRTSAVQALLQCGAVPVPDAAGLSPHAAALARCVCLSACDCGAQRCAQLLPAIPAPSLLPRPLLTHDCSGVARVIVLIPPEMPHPGAGSYIIDGGFTETFLQRLEQLHRALPRAPAIKASCSSRSYYCDVQSWVRAAFSSVLATAAISCAAGQFTHIACASPNGTHNGCNSTATVAGTSLSSLSIDPSQPGSASASTQEDEDVSPPAQLPRHSMAHMRFLHYETVGGFLPAHIDLARTGPEGSRSTHTFILYLADCAAGGETALLRTLGRDAAALAVVQPRRGRLLLFPHVCPHEGRAVVDVPKLLLRGELY